MTTVDELTRAYGPPPEPEQPRKRSLRRKVAILVAVLVGLPALAWAALYLFGLFSGSATVNDSSATISVLAVQGTDKDGNAPAAPNGPAGFADASARGLNCDGSSLLEPVAGQPLNVNLTPIAYRVNVNGAAATAETVLGTCKVRVTIKNNSVAPNAASGQVSAVIDPINGWEFVPSAPITLQPGETGAITVTITASGNAAPLGGGSSPITGKLNVQIPPPNA